MEKRCVHYACQDGPIHLQSGHGFIRLYCATLSSFFVTVGFGSEVSKGVILLNRPFYINMWFVLQVYMVKMDILSSRLFLSDNQKTENTEQTGIFRNLTSQLGVGWVEYALHSEFCKKRAPLRLKRYKLFSLVLLS